MAEIAKIGENGRLRCGGVMLGSVSPGPLSFFVAETISGKWIRFGGPDVTTEPSPGREVFREGCIPRRTTHCMLVGKHTGI